MARSASLQSQEDSGLRKVIGLMARSTIPAHLFTQTPVLGAPPRDCRSCKQNFAAAQRERRVTLCRLHTTPHTNLAHGHTSPQRSIGGHRRFPTRARRNRRCQALVRRCGSANRQRRGAKTIEAASCHVV